jgi:BetI-type transcriptional repressor, C-terminal
VKKRGKAASPRRRIARERTRRRRARARRARVPAPAPAPASVAPTPPAAAPPGATATAVATQVEQRGRPIVAALARIARGSEPPRARLEQAIRLLLAAYGESDPDFSGLFLTGWARARHDKQFRLTLAWQREQIRLSLEDILTEGMRTRRFRGDLDPGAVAAVIVGAAEGCLLQAATEGGAVPAERLVGALLTLAVSGA